MKFATTPGTLGIFPMGWHVPTDAEWSTLTTFLGGVDIAGGKIKSTDTIEAGTGLWSELNFAATNESGFTAVPGGFRGYLGSVYNLGKYAYWWSSCENNGSYSWRRDTGYDESFVYRFSNEKHDGFSVRCVRDL